MSTPSHDREIFGDAANLAASASWVLAAEKPRLVALDFSSTNCGNHLPRELRHLAYLRSLVRLGIALPSAQSPAIGRARPRATSSAELAKPFRLQLTRTTIRARRLPIAAVGTFSGPQQVRQCPWVRVGSIGLIRPLRALRAGVSERCATSAKIRATPCLPPWQRRRR